MSHETYVKRISLGDGTYTVDGVTYKIEGVDRLLEDAYKAGVAAQDLRDLTYSLASPIARLAKTLVPIGRSKNLYGSIRASKARSKIMVRASSKRTPYAGVNHWGRDGETGPKWLSRAEETLRPQTYAGLTNGITELLEKNGL